MPSLFWQPLQGAASTIFRGHGADKKHELQEKATAEAAEVMTGGLGSASAPGGTTSATGAGHSRPAPPKTAAHMTADSMVTSIRETCSLEALE